MPKKASWIYVLGAVILAFGLWLIVPDRALCSTAKTIDTLAETCEITYQGVGGVSALDLLKVDHEVELQHFDFGEMVKSIDGVEPDASHFWAFYVNGTLADKGADSYITENFDTVTWKLEKIQNQ